LLYFAEHSVNYPDTSKADAAAADKLKFIDTINPLLSFSNDDLDDMNKDFDQFFESDGSSSSSDEPLDMGKISKCLFVETNI
jgi:RNA polymerase II subunit A C-terminal domain phosphatase